MPVAEGGAGKRAGAGGGSARTAPERARAAPGGGAVPARGDAVGGHAGGGARRAEEGLGRRHVPVLAQHGVDQVAVPVDGAVEVTPAAPDLQVSLVHEPGATAGTPLPTATPPKFLGKDGRELRLPLAYRLVAEHDAALEEHLAEVAQGQAVAQPPQHHEGDDVARVLRPVQQAGTALIELPATVAAAAPAGGLGGGAGGGGG